MRIRVGHVSMQFSDTPKQHTQDVNKIFARAQRRRIAWITGTEAGPGSGRLGNKIVAVARQNGYRAWVPSVQSEGRGQHTDSWVAVRESFIGTDWKRGYIPAIPGSGSLEDESMNPDKKRWAPKGLAHVSFKAANPELGQISIGSAHYLTGGKSPNSPYSKMNQKLAEVIGEWATEQGKGPALVFYGGDQNMNDRKADTFFGEDLTSTWDELKKWPNTGHGNIDVIATYNKDGRVEALRAEAFNDNRFRLHTDHFFIEAVLSVRPRAK